MKSKPDSHRKTVQKTASTKKHNKFLIIIFLFAALIGAFRIANWRYYNQEASEAKEFIREVRLLKIELESKFGIRLKEDGGCTQSRGKSSTKNSAWGCHVSISGFETRPSTIITVKDALASKAYFVSPFKNTGYQEDIAYYYKSKGGPACGTHSNVDSNLLTIYCSFGIPNGSANQVFKELGISRPASNND